MSAPDAMSESLNFPSMKRRAVASRSYRVKVSPSNGQNFTAGQTVNIDLPSNLAGTYINWNQCYLKMKVQSAGFGYTLDRCGAAGFIQRVQCMTAGAQIFDLPNWNVLMTILMDGDSSPAYKAGVGNVLMGTNGGFQAGETNASTDERTYCVPFTLHPFALSQPHRLQPLFSSSPVQFKITLESILNAVQSTGTAPTALSFTEVELVCVFTELSPGAQAQVDQMSGGVYNVLAASYQNVGTTMVDAASAVTANLGLSVSSLERIIVCHRPTTSLNDITKFSLGNRAKNGLQQYQFFINSESYPARPVVVENNAAEALAEYLLSDHSLVNFDKQSSFNVAVKSNASYSGNGTDAGGAIAGIAQPFIIDEPTGTLVGGVAVSSNIGSFITAVELETGLSDGRSQRLYSGVSTISSTVNYRGVYDTANSGDAQIDFFAQFTVLLSLNTRDTNVWSVSV
jgi:hypothetical protein